MNTRLCAESILRVINDYQEALKDFSEEEFCRKPESGRWSYAEIYCHIIQVNMRSLLAVEKCIYGKQQQKRDVAPLISRLILYFGQLPPGRIRIPANISAIVKVITKEEAKNDLIKFTGKLNELMPKILKCSPYQRIRHQRLGMLNCNEWIRFIEIYSIYHFKSLQKMKDSKR
ncbi:DinB family protein [Arcticibacter tournemirensis]|uniref:DinB family protein n=1 Tax=Arcticibacter tournemirensis TaxID=699437 RepID=A0A4Q0MDW6_9SPHI|nr:DinB family protein [Arcticibacter tournemirensis]RXF71607.1 DinB family protein [Arcticibacter tournemirensis]